MTEACPPPAFAEAATPAFLSTKYGGQAQAGTAYLQEGGQSRFLPLQLN